MNDELQQLQQHLPKLAELAVEVENLARDGDEAKLREKAGRLGFSVLVLVKILRARQRRGEP